MLLSQFRDVFMEGFVLNGSWKGVFNSFIKALELLLCLLSVWLV